MKCDEPFQVFAPSRSGPLPRLGRSITLALRAHPLFPAGFLSAHICGRLTFSREVAFSSGFRCVAGNPYCAGQAFLCDTLFVDHAPVCIGHGVGFSYRNIVITSTHAPGHMDVIEARLVTAEDHCWSNSGCIILGRVAGGAHSVTGARSVVACSIPPGRACRRHPLPPDQGDLIQSKVPRNCPPP